ncbi:Kiwa anti-phage protein KwaB-like domain-containing protein [Phaeobacter gallaeciensis]|uniref:Kiwa anti-phage protein KwaB-like domain-containing protein n=3 Tax=Pseudomonadota TaxID=1224 RepID=UPI000C0D1F5A|nr:Kiwa anti-phage protein KwaB-like domain-containing protein [Henriciella sp.]PHR80973.1 MAG: DUF4868 domain-containing protein [Henriciella sp.]
MPILDDLKALNLDVAHVNLWTVKGPVGPISQAPTYPAKWVETTAPLDASLKQIFTEQLELIEEVFAYGLLAQNNEASALSIPADETHVPSLLAAIAAETAPLKVSQTKHLLNTNFYVAKIIVGDDIAYAVKKTAKSWKTKQAHSVRSAIFQDQVLTVDEQPHFELSRSFDFIVFGEDVLILDKGKFESVLRYRQAQQSAFVDLQNEVEFQNLFVDMAPLIAHVGANKIQLRRACAIRDKGHYRDMGFMDRLRANQAEYGLMITFDANGRIIATPETCAQIMTALLDHRLKSGFSTLVYDVQDTTPIQV